MAKPLYIKVAGEQKVGTQDYYKQDGMWKSARLRYLREDGIWKHKHDFLDYELLSEGTCISKEKYRYNCPCGCGGSTQEGEINPNNHTGSVELADVTAATCRYEGWEVYNWNCCNTLDDVTFLPLDPNNHTDLYYSAPVEPTCTDAGQEVTEWCDACGYRSGGDPIEPLGHDFVTGVYYDYVDELYHVDVAVCTRCLAEGSRYLDDHTNDPNNPGYCLYCGGICKA